MCICRSLQSATFQSGGRRNAGLEDVTWGASFLHVMALQAQSMSGARRRGPIHRRKRCGKPNLGLGFFLRVRRRNVDRCWRRAFFELVDSVTFRAGGSIWRFTRAQIEPGAVMITSANWISLEEEATARRGER